MSSARAGDGFFAASADQGLLQLSLLGGDGTPLADAPGVAPAVRLNLAADFVAPTAGGGLLVGGTFGVDGPSDPDDPPHQRPPASGVEQVVDVVRFVLR